MEKINIQTNKLKLNVTNIKSSLISSNKKLKKLRSDKTSLIIRSRDQEEKLKKEKAIESPMEGLGKFGRMVGGIARNIARGPLSFFDKIKEFFGLILTGIIINNLPYIIDQIKGFFDRNKWLVEGTKFILSMIGKGIMGIINLVDKFTPSQQDKINSDAKKLKEEFSKLDRNLDDDNSEINKRLAELEKEERDRKNQEDKSQKQNAERISQRQQVREFTPSPGSINPQSTNPAPQTRRTSQKPPEVPKFAKGGLVQPRKSVDTSTQPQARKTMTAGASSLGTTQASVRSKRAVQTVNYFSFFNNNNQVSEEIAEKDFKNTESFKKILVSLKSIQEIRKQIGDDEGGGPGGGNGDGDGGAPIVTGPGIEGLSQFVAKAETGGRYDAYSGDRGRGDPRMLNMTLTELSRNYSMAVGAHQFMPSTAIGLARKIGLDPDKTIFNKETQDRLNKYHLNSMGYADYLSGSLSQKEYGRRIAQQYRALPDPYTGSTFADQYAKYNRATVTLNQFNAALENAKRSKNDISGGPNTTPTQGSLAAVLPQGRPQFTSGFRTPNRPNHQGIDIGVDANSPVAALQDGVVETIIENFGDPGWGDAVVVRHSDGTKWIYGHVISSVREGDSVKRGQIIAKVKYWPYGVGGNYRYQNNTHLHLEKVVGGRKVNPTSYLNNQRNLTQLSSNPQSRNLDPTSSTSGKTLVAVLPIVNNNTNVVPYPIPV